MQLEGIDYLSSSALSLSRMLGLFIMGEKSSLPALREGPLDAGDRALMIDASKSVTCITRCVGASLRLLCVYRSKIRVLLASLAVALALTCDSRSSLPCMADTLAALHSSLSLNSFSRWQALSAANAYRKRMNSKIMIPMSVQ